MFGTVEDMKRLWASTVGAMDGTFKVCPWMSYQLFNIHSFPSSLTGSLSELSCLLPDKTGTTYSRLVMLLKSKAEELGLALYLNVLLVDFEQIIGTLHQESLQHNGKGLSIRLRPNPLEKVTKPRSGYTVQEEVW